MDFTEDEKTLAASGLDGTVCICLINAFDISEEKNDTWKESGKKIPIRWVMPCAIIDLEEDRIGELSCFILTIEFSNRRSEWNAQRIKFSSNRIAAIAEAKKIIKNLLKWPLEGKNEHRTK